MIEVTCAVITHQNKILVTQRSISMKMPLKWEFPGGKIEANESAEACLLREIREEIGINIQLLQKLKAVEFDYGSFQIRLLPYLAAYLDGEIHLTEHVTYRWLSIDKLSTLDWAEADVAVVEDVVKINLKSNL